MIEIVKNFRKRKKVIKYIAEHLSEDIKAELRIHDEDADPTEVLINHTNESVTGFICYDKDGNPRGIGGVLPNRNIWFVVTEGLERSDFVPWLKRARDVTAELLKKHRPLWGHCYENNELSLIWMKWCGFDFASADSAANYEINGKKFIYFQKN